MARYTFNLPDIGEGIAEAEIVTWHVAVGDVVAEDSPLADMMTDKATVEMESPVAGTVAWVAGEVGDVVAIGSPLVVVETGGDVALTPAIGELAPAAAEPQKPSPLEGRGLGEGTSEASAAAAVPLSPTLFPEGERESGQHPAAKPLASPAVRARAKELGVDLAQVRPHEDGRIRHADLDAYLSYTDGFGASAKTRPDEIIKVTGLRRRIAENMAASKRAIPHFTFVEECDVTALEELRAQLNTPDRPKLTILPLLITAICRALPDFPMINARYDDEANVVTRHGAVHMGIATMTDAGLMVPVIRDAHSMGLWQLAREIARLAEAARSGKAKAAELSGSTLTITSLGPLGGIATTPVINRPEVAIIGPNRIVERPAFVPDGMGGERIAKRKLMNISISCDHRVVDGYDAAAFVQSLKVSLENPARIIAG
jgi:2-oxoisovalerate dehydrogenase E2 component (dihydrolipoyl transacylase)